MLLVRMQNGRHYKMAEYMETVADNADVAVNATLQMTAAIRGYDSVVTFIRPAV